MCWRGSEVSCVVSSNDIFEHDIINPNSHPLVNYVSIASRVYHCDTYSLLRYIFRIDPKKPLFWDNKCLQSGTRQKYGGWDFIQLPLPSKMI